MYVDKVGLKYFSNASTSGSLFQTADMASSTLYSETLLSGGNGSQSLLGDFWCGNWFLRK
jgi:hypothetical protein